MTSTVSMINTPHIAVIGAGVVGLTTAIKIQELGYSVTIIAEILPTDPKSPRYTSHWAGAHHVSDATTDNPRQVEIDRETFQVMWNMSQEEAEGCFLRLTQTDFFEEKKPRNSSLEMMPDFRYLEDDELKVVPHSKSGITFTTLTIDVPIYLNYLLSRFLAKGGTIHRASVQHIGQVAEGAFSRIPDAIIICAGLGARTLGGVEDKDVYPIRGQTVLVRAPWIKFGRSSYGALSTNIIPRRSGDVILGSIRTANDWYPKPRPEITESILKRALILCPELVPQHSLKDGQTPSIEDIKPFIIEEGCGLRPGRKGGIRLETSFVETFEGKKIPLVYNYGHAAAGYQSSWGSARMAVDLLNSVLNISTYC